MYYYSYENLKRITQTEAGKEIVNEFERVYNENYANVPIPVINYSYVKLFYQNGDRKLHESIYFDRRKRLALLQVLAIADDKWLDPLEEVLAAICDEFTWVLPAHNLTEDKTFEYVQIDLFSAETGFYLAETAYILKDKLSADIQKRIKISLEEKIVKVCEKHVVRFDTTGNNWAAVCAGSVGLTYLYAFPERFSLVKARVFAALERYLSGLGEDGYCFEGSGYWFYGFGFFSIFFDVYTQLTGERHEMLNRSKVKNVLQYFKNARMDGKVFLPFADGGNANLEANPWYFYTFKNLFEEDCELPVLGKIVSMEKALGARILNGVDRFATAQTVPEKKKETVYYPSGQVFLHKNANYAFAAKGGHNGEFHNHNNVGAFQIVKNQKQLIADLGAGEYTKGYFVRNDGENERYGKKVFVCHSFSHSVPIVDGSFQKFNSREYRGEVVKQTDDCFTLDISKAYGLELGTVVVSYEMQEKGVRVFYACKGIQESVIFRFMSVIKPQIKEGNTVIDELTIKNDRAVMPTYEKAEYKNHSAETVYAYLIDYKVEGEESFEITFSFSLKKESR